MTLPFRHGIQNLGPGGLRPSWLPLGYGIPSNNIESLRVSGEENVVSLKLEGQSGVRTRDLPLSKHAALTEVGPPGLPGQCARETVCFAWTVLNQQRIELIRHWANVSGLPVNNCSDMRFFRRWDKKQPFGRSEKWVVSCIKWTPPDNNVARSHMNQRLRRLPTCRRSLMRCCFVLISLQAWDINLNAESMSSHRSSNINLILDQCLALTAGLVFKANQTRGYLPTPLFCSALAGALTFQ